MKSFVQKYSNQSFRTQFRRGQTASIQRRVYEEAIEITVKTIEYMEWKIKQEDS